MILLCILSASASATRASMLPLRYERQSIERPARDTVDEDGADHLTGRKHTNQRPRRAVPCMHDSHAGERRLGGEGPFHVHAARHATHVAIAHGGWRTVHQHL